jgi:dynactin complex subunit
MSDLYWDQFQVGDHILYGAEKGVVKFVGNTDFSSGLWIGVELENQGKLLRDPDSGIRSL